MNQLEKAEELSLRSLELRRRILGEENPRTLSRALILARIYVQQQQFDEAGPLTESGAPVESAPSRRVERSVSALPVEQLGWAYLEQGHVAKADTFATWRCRPCDASRTPARWCSLASLLEMGAVRLAQGKYSEAETLLRESSRLAEKRWPDAAYRFYVMSLLGASLAGQKKYADAEPLLLQGYEGLSTAPGQPVPVSQRPAPDHGIPRTAGATLRRLGQTRPSRRVETETG